MTLIVFNLDIRAVIASMLMEKDLLHSDVISVRLSYKHALCDSLTVTEYWPIRVKVAPVGFPVLFKLPH